MNLAKDSGVETLDPGAIWLELSFEGQTLAFELPADETRAIAVGSLFRADVRIDRPGVAPVHFHFERENDELWIVPGYASEPLRVDTARVTGPRRIDSRAVVEFCGLRLEATVLEGPPSPRRRASLVCLRQGGLSECAVRAASPTFHAPAQFEQPTTRFVPLTTPVARVERTAVTNPCRVVPIAGTYEKPPITVRTGASPAGPATVVLSPVSISDLTSPDTIETTPFWLDEPEPALEEVAQQFRAPRVPSQPRPIDGSSLDALAPIMPTAIYSVGAASTSTPESPLSVSTPNAPTEALALDGPVAPAEDAPAPQEGDTQQTTYFEPVRISQAPFAPESQERSARKAGFEAVSPALKQPLILGWLSQLGTLSKCHPILIWVMGTLAVFALSAAIAKVSRQPKPAAHLPSAIATGRAASPEPSPMPVSPSLGHGPRPLVVIPVVAPATSIKPKKGQPANPELVSAVDALNSGHYVEARAAYARLSAESPNDRALQATTTLLEKKLSPECSSRRPTSVVSCPEVKQ